MRGVYRGMSMKASDEFILGLCHVCHTHSHSFGDETDFFRQYGIYNPVELAKKYRAKYQNLKQ